MSLCVLRRNGDGKYVCPPGQENSYTDDLAKAYVYDSREHAEKNRCGNETVVEVPEIQQRRLP